MMIKKFKSFIDRSKITYTCLYDLGLKKFKVQSDGKVDVMGDVDITYRRLEILPIKFGNISGNFDCSNNRLRDLKNCPEFVDGIFNCGSNYIENIDNLPKKIGQHLYLNNNKITS